MVGFRFSKLILCFFLIFILSFSEKISGTVYRVIDGDTFWLKNNGKLIKIRLYGIDSPELDQDYGREAKKFVSSITKRSPVTVYVKYTDQYDRLIGIVVLDDGTVLNQRMLLNGTAWWYRYYAKNELSFKILEAYAREKHLGLWHNDSPTAPWIFRRQK